MAKRKIRDRSAPQLARPVRKESVPQVEGESKKPGRIRNWLGIVYTVASATIIIVGTYCAIRWANGDFRLDQSADLVASETGLLHATSNPQGAEVYINGKLTSVTDNSVYLSPGEYEVEIKKDGYSPWRKNILIERALVSRTNATLFPYSPSLTSLTFTGVNHPVRSPDGTKVLFYLDNASVKNKNGLYVLDLVNRSPTSRQISDDDGSFDLEKAEILWSPDSSEVLVVTDEQIFLLNSNSFANLHSSPDVELQLKTILLSWEDDLAIREKQFVEKEIHPEILATILGNSINAFLSPDSTKILYVATGEAEITSGLVSPKLAPNSQPEVRVLVAGQMYVYDSEEDRNYLVGEVALPELSAEATSSATSSAKLLLTQPERLAVNAPGAGGGKTVARQRTLQGETLSETVANFTAYYGGNTTQAWQWMTNSTHLVGIVNNQIVIMSYDGTNQTAIYSGPLANDFVLPNWDSNSVLILTTFNPDTPANLYAIELKR
jgi:hypothetical protein